MKNLREQAERSALAAFPWRQPNNGLALVRDLMQLWADHLAADLRRDIDVDRMIEILTAYLDGDDVDVLVAKFIQPGYMPDAAARSRLYWFARDCVYERHVTGHPSNVVAWTRTVTTAWIRAIQGIATENPAIGSTDNILHGALEKLLGMWIDLSEPLALVLDWRIRDAYGGRLPDDFAVDLRDAFIAAWSVGEYSTAYGMLASVEP